MTRSLKADLESPSQIDAVKFEPNQTTSPILKSSVSLQSFSVTMTTDAEAQEDELLALESIYDAQIFVASAQGDSPGGQFVAHLELPPLFCVKVSSNASGSGEENAGRKASNAKLFTSGKPQSCQQPTQVFCFKANQNTNLLGKEIPG